MFGMMDYKAGAVTLLSPGTSQETHNSFYCISITKAQ